jgi:hypothetical protein
LILFIVAALNDDNFADLVSIGLACLTGALLAEEVGLERLMRGRRVR